uniref:Uncharacterized protein n=2 Tax=viral metagenome TaxID=1070528 RepID=A0A6H1ZBW0_9ZZZZ
MKKKGGEKSMIRAKLVDLINDCIEIAGDHGIPSGHLYAMLMGSMDLETYNSIIDDLKVAGTVTESNYLLKSVK